MVYDKEAIDKVNKTLETISKSVLRQTRTSGGGANVVCR